jgi:hypothetical protein
MKVIVVFDFPDIKDVESNEADFWIDALSADLKNLEDNVGYNWHIEDATEA